MRPALLAALLFPSLLGAQFLAGAGRREITPLEAVPMWGYGARHDALSTGALDTLYADALVLQAGGRKLAVVGLDLGRSPSEESLQRIRERLSKMGIAHSLIAGSHTHHGPVLELSEKPGMGQGKFDAALRYYRRLEDSIVAAVAEADSKLEPAKVGSGSALLENYNRNRHTRQLVKPVDRELSILRFDKRSGKPLALVVNFAAHPTMLPAQTLKFSADYCGSLKAFLRGRTGAVVLFMQGAAGDLSVNDGPNKGHQVFGAALGAEALKIFAAMLTREEPRPSIAVREERFRFSSRIDFSNPLLRAVFAKAFFPELVPNYVAEYADGIRPRLTVAVLNNEIALVGASGEFFSSHAIRLKRRARVKQVFFFGYANGYHQYFPTIEAAAEGGYGADNTVSPAEVGAGERMMDSALIWIYQLAGRIR